MGCLPSKIDLKPKKRRLSRIRSRLANAGSNASDNRKLSVTTDTGGCNELDASQTERRPNTVQHLGPSTAGLSARDEEDPAGVRAPMTNSISTEAQTTAVTNPNTGQVLGDGDHAASFTTPGPRTHSCIPSAPLPSEPSTRSPQLHRPPPLNLTRTATASLTTRRRVSSSSATGILDRRLSQASGSDYCPQSSITQYFTPQSTPAVHDSSGVAIPSHRSCGTGNNQTTRYFSDPVHPTSASVQQILPIPARSGSFSSEYSSSSDSVWDAGYISPNSTPGQSTDAVSDLVLRAAAIPRRNQCCEGRLYPEISRRQQRYFTYPYNSRHGRANNIFHMEAGSSFNGTVNGNSNVLQLHLVHPTGSRNVNMGFPNHVLGHCDRNKRGKKAIKKVS
ncbi:hypothetical protein BJ508DRAFT_415229 [Ascobolus immersus RN42]|uniref:Uncharacterized protein n=1 Tax=Ascobolus immersus RN42 TaxID=1160509 RepID=A0A3N4I410_ASCIM|nr:hypothetical protein BJ508DRAFT_415229 [Ascobolus immersus RN42]